MFWVFVFSVLVSTKAARIDRGALTSMDQASLDSFTKMFRTTLLNKVAAEWNTTITMTNALKAKMSTCNNTINRQVQSCKTCTQSACQQNPSFSDYLALANPYTYLEGPLKDLTGKFGEVANLLGDEATHFFTSLKGVAGEATDKFTSGISSTFDGVLQGIKDLGSQISGLGHQAGNALTDAGHAIEHVGSSIGHAIGSIFGKRDLDPKLRECMNKCSACHPLLLPKDQMVSQVCGSDIVTMNKTIVTRVTKIKGVYDAALDTTHPILSKVEYDMTSANAKMQLTRVYLTVRLNGREVRYQTSVPYAMMQLPQTAHDIALEYWNKFQ